MPDYANGKNVLLRRPEPGRPSHPPVKPEKEENKTPQPQMDVDLLADAVVRAMAKKALISQNIQAKGQDIDTFDTSASMKKLADVMTNQKDKEANVKGLGKVQETKKDQKETDKTIDLLSKLGE